MHLMNHRLLYPVLLTALFGCPMGQDPPVAVEPTLEELQAEYEQAVADAAIAEPAEISRELTSITADNPDLIWSGAPGESKVLMVTWTSWDGYTQAVGESMQLTRDVWVTAAPQAQEFCRSDGATGDDLDLRLEQLLGLPPEDGNTTFAEFWVDPADLFRPSADPEITDHEAGLTFPQVADFLTISPAFMEWFNALMGSSYGADGYPWTRLGYTYDWGNSDSEIGLSEFIIRSGATVIVRDTQSTEDYCAISSER